MKRGIFHIALVMPWLAFTLTACNGDTGGSFARPPPEPPPEPPNVVLEPVFAQLPSFTAPVALLQAPADASRWFVVEQRGIVWVFDNDPAAAASTVFANITDRVDSAPDEGGLLGMAFHPDFATNGEVFLSYTRSPPFESVVSRFTIDSNTGNLDTASEEIILTALQPFINHNGGQVLFGPDGYLYAGFGDGGGAGDPGENGQDTTNYLGAIVRVDVDSAAPYAIPPDNPFAGNTNCMAGSGQMDCPEIYAWGFRNPWRFSFDRQTDFLWVGDVGENAWEEVDRVDLGLNFGWNDREGAHCFDPPVGCVLTSVDPITEYNHSVGASVTGGYVYRGSAIPSLRGYYVFGDFISGRLWTVAAGSPQQTLPDELLDTPHNISSFGEAVDGGLYLLSWNLGRIYRLAAAP